MNDAFWKQYPDSLDIHCLELKDRLQERVAAGTRDLEPEAVVAWLTEASVRFWKEQDRSASVHP